MTTQDVVALIHLVGFLTGVALYAMLAVMIGRRRTQPIAGGRYGDAIPMATAVTGLTWNVGALFLYALRDFGLAEPPLLAAAAFSALGLLPAFVVHSALPPDAGIRWRRVLVGGAYGLSAVAACINIVSSLHGDPPPRASLLLLSVGFVVILGVIALGMRRREDARRALTVVALAAFAVSAFHLSSAESEGTELWALALIGHHASIPLALVILYQDYRFALVDTVLRRALALVALVAVASALYVVVGAPLLDRLAATSQRGVIQPTLIIGLLVMTALVYPWLQRLIGQFVDRVLLQRGDYAVLRRDLSERLSAADTPEAILDAACDAVGRVLGVAVGWRQIEASQSAVEVIVERFAYSASVRIPTNDAPSFIVETGSLSGGRRFLSDDVALLESVGALVGRRIDAVRVTIERIERDVREQEALRLAAEAELRAVRAQLHPHFLFNALTTVAHLMREAPDRALDTLYKLTGLLRAVLKSPPSDAVPLGEELEIVEAYLAIEHARFEDRLVVEIDVPADLRMLRIPPFLVQPLVENAVKHGIGPLRAGGRIRVSGSIECANGSGAASDQTLCLAVEDTGAGVTASELTRRRRERVGLSSIEQRLDRQFGDAASLTIDSQVGRGTRAVVRLPVGRS